MEPDVRAGVAYAVLRRVTTLPAEFVYDHFAGRRYSWSGEISADRIHLFDPVSASHFGGAFNGIRYCLWHHRNRYYVDLTITDKQFRGFDHSRKTFFHGAVTGADLDMCDYATGLYYRYSI